MGMLTLGNTAKGEESPTSPPVNEAVGVWTLKPIFTSENANTLSRII